MTTLKSNTNTAKEIANIIVKDGGEVIKANQFDSVLIIDATLESKSQLDRILKVGIENNMFKNGEVEVNGNKLVLSVVINA